MPYFNAPIFLQNKTQVGKIEEIFGSITVPVRLSLFLFFSLLVAEKVLCGVV